MYCLKMTNLLDFFDIIYSGITHHFVQCFSLIGIIKKRDRPRFQTARFPEFWQSAIPANEGKKNAKTLGSCKPNAHCCANLKARDRDRPHKFLTNFYFPSLFKDE